MSTAQVSYSTAPTGAEAPVVVDPTKEINATATNPAGTAAPASADRPAWLPGNFDTVEAYNKSYVDQRAELTRLQQAAAKAKGEPEVPVEGAEKPAEPALKIEEAKPGTPAAEEAAKDAVAKAGLDVSVWQTEFNTTGDVTSEGREKIAEGLKAQFGENARAIVDDFIEGQKVRSENRNTQLFETAGGKEQYAAMMQWAATSIPAAEQNAYNAAMDSGDLNTQTLAIDGLKARFERVNGHAPALLSGENGGDTSTAGYASTAEMTRAINDPRYAKDTAYRKSVEARIGKSNW